MQVAQENSFDSMKGVVEYGADGFEVDVFMTADGELVCFHDQNTLVIIKSSCTLLAVVISKFLRQDYRCNVIDREWRKNYTQWRLVTFVVLVVSQ